MRIAIASPILLFCVPSVVLAIDSVPSPNHARIALKARNPAAAAAPASSASASTKPYKGTEAAPVDGLDGMPHAGPFVEINPDRSKGDASSPVKSVPTSLKNLKDSTTDVIPEKNDGVMNDENRPVPQEGTRGTAGGVSEKSKERKAKGNPQSKPQSPTEARPLPHSEQEKLDAHLESTSESKDRKSTVSKDSTIDSAEGKQSRTQDKKSNDFGEGGIGMEKPSDLPEKPHNIPHPDPKGPTTLKPSSKGEDGPPVAHSGKSSKTSSNTDDSNDELQWHEWIHSFVLSLTMILVSEIGDKTFLIAALMAMRHPRLLVFTAAFSALIAMTILSAVLGHAVPTLLPKRFTTFAAALLFFVFGTRMLREGLAMPKDSGVGEEMAEVEAELEEKEHEASRNAHRRRSSVSPYALESGRSRKESHLHRSHPSPSSSRGSSPSASRQNPVAGLTNLLSLVLSPAWVQTFIMTFLGEWGDRSQIATIAMAAGQDYWWVTLGAITGHACCTGVAVLGGRALAGRVSMRMGKFFFSFMSF